MARLVPPNESIVRERAQISGQSPAAGVSMGRELEQVGTEYLEKSRAAARSTALSQALNQATESFSTAAAERQHQVTDEKGKPLFSTMGNDIRTLGEATKANVLATIDDPEVARRFELEFSNFASNRVLASQKVARQQQIDFSRAELNNSLQGLTRQATQVNPSQLGEYEGMASRRIDELAQAGMISQQEAVNLFNTFSRGVRIESYRNLISENPGLVREQLENIPLVELGINESDKDKLIEEIDAKEKDIAAEQDLIIRKQEEAAAQQAKLSVLRTINGIAEGTVGLAELEEVKDTLGSDDFSKEANYLKLKNRIISQRARLNKEANTNKQIFTDISNGGRLEGKYKDKEIDTAYQAAVQAMTDPEEGVKLETKILAASQFKGKVKSLQNELHGVALDSEDPERISSALQGYHMLTTQRPEVLEGMDKESNAIMAYASDLVVNSAIGPQEAMENARNAVLNADTPVMESRSSRLKELKREERNKVGPLSDSGIEELIIDNFTESGFFDFLPFIGDEASIAPGVIERMRSVLEDAFMQTGSLKAAKAMAMNALKRDYGTTTLNGGSHVMFSPPEKFYPNLSEDELHASSREFVRAHTGLDIASDRIKVNSDQFTRGLFLEDGEAITYTIEYLDDEGIPKLIQSKDGAIMRWIPGKEDIIAEEARKREERNKAAEENEGKSALDMIDDLGDVGAFR